MPGARADRSVRSGRFHPWLFRLALATGVLVISWQNVKAASEALTTLAHLPTPPQATLQLVSDGLVQSGSEVTIVSLTSARSVQSVLQFYREFWQSEEGMTGSIDNRAGSWQLVSRMEPDYLLIVQMQADSNGGSRGWLSLTRPRSEAWLEEGSPGSTDLAPDVAWLPSGAHLVSRSGAQDLPGQSDVRIAYSELPAESIVDFYLRRLPADWSARLMESSSEAAVLQLSRPGSSVDVVVTRSGNLSIITLSHSRLREPLQ